MIFYKPGYWLALNEFLKILLFPFITIKVHETRMIHSPWRCGDT